MAQQVGVPLWHGSITRSLPSRDLPGSGPLNVPFPWRCGSALSASAAASSAAEADALGFSQGRDGCWQWPCPCAFTLAPGEEPGTLNALLMPEPSCCLHSGWGHGELWLMHNH